MGALLAGLRAFLTEFRHGRWNAGGISPIFPCQQDPPAFVIRKWEFWRISTGC
jgi:hypothetical protein